MLMFVQLKEGGQGMSMQIKSEEGNTTNILRDRCNYVSALP
jgi:hypothetical protein